MRIAVISCAAYRDCWGPFVTLFRRFWPHCEYPLWLVTDEDSNPNYNEVFAWKGDGPQSWCERVVKFAAQSTEPILLFLDDFFLTQPVRVDMVEEALSMCQKDADCVRLFPCPGADQNFGHPYFGLVKQDAPYRISTMPAIWKPKYLAEIASQCTNPWSFEIDGTRISSKDSSLILAFKREVQPWPLEFICTGILRSKWTPGALKLFKEQDIYLDSTREVLA